ncbi:hypothetical protein N7448_010972 [Penicillium atrosanguineum]|nr:hypothetical protein N7448_010972 [Penicillium atrosanguineum]
MSAIPKLPSADRRQSFRSRLQRALALSPSESEDPRSHSGSVAGDTTEEEEGMTALVPGDGAPTWVVSRKMLDPIAIRGQTLEKRWKHPDRLMPLETVTCLPSNASQSECPVSPGIKFCGLPAYDHQTGHPNEVSRTASGENYTAHIVLSSMQDSLSHQLNDTICSDLEEFRDRLAAVDVAMEITAKDGRARRPNESDRGNASSLEIVPARMRLP